MDEETIKDILQNKDEKIEMIHARMLGLYEETGKETILSEMALPKIQMGGMPGGKGGHKELADIIIAYQKQVSRQNEEVREMMWELTAEEETVNRVWSCFHVLDNPYYMILDSLYVKKQLYQTVEKSFQMSHKTFEKYRSEGIELLIKFYESEYRVSDLMRIYRTRKKKKKAGNKGVPAHKQEGYKQMTLGEITNIDSIK